MFRHQGSGGYHAKKRDGNRNHSHRRRSDSIEVLASNARADVTNCEVVVTECPDAPALGCAILASIGVGIYKTADEACGRMVKRLETIFPNVKSAAEYEKVCSRTYSKLYGLCKAERRRRRKKKKKKTQSTRTRRRRKKRKTNTSGGDATKTTSALLQNCAVAFGCSDHAQSHLSADLGRLTVTSAIGSASTSSTASSSPWLRLDRPRSNLFARTSPRLS